MKNEPNEITIDGTSYVKKGIGPKDVSGDYYIIRAYSAGVFAGILDREEGDDVIMKSCRRIHYWDGAASLSQMAIEGVSKPENCRFSVHTFNHKIKGVIELISCTQLAREKIEGVAEWKE